MTHSVINSVACGLIFIGALWCAFSRQVNTGVFGTLLLGGAGIGALAAFFGPRYGYHAPPPAEEWLNVCAAGLVVRMMLLSFIRPWVPNIKYQWWLFRRARSHHQQLPPRGGFFYGAHYENYRRNRRA